MQLIEVQKGILINPDKISSIEIKNIRSKKTVVITLEGRTIPLEVGVDKFLKELLSAGVKFNEQFWAI